MIKYIIPWNIIYTIQYKQYTIAKIIPECIIIHEISWKLTLENLGIRPMKKPKEVFKNSKDKKIIKNLISKEKFKFSKKFLKTIIPRKKGKKWPKTSLEILDPSLENLTIVSIETSWCL